MTYSSLRRMSWESSEPPLQDHKQMAGNPLLPALSWTPPLSPREVRCTKEMTFKGIQSFNAKFLKRDSRPTQDCEKISPRHLERQKYFGPSGIARWIQQNNVEVFSTQFFTLKKILPKKLR